MSVCNASLTESEFDMQNINHHLKTYAKIDHAALEGNYLAIRDYISRETPDCRIMCVVKADAYGHGAEGCVKRLASLGVRSYAVSCIEEARDVAAAAPKGSDILILGYTPAEYAAELSRSGFIQTVYSEEYGRELSREAERAECDVRVHIKVDTGMNRIGFIAAHKEACARSVVAVMDMPHIRTEGIFTHFACADSGTDEETEHQHELFCGVLDAMGERAKGLCVHCCNSAAAMRFSRFRHDMVRVGIILFGLAPDAEMRLPIGLSPVMTFTTTVIHVHDLHAGDRISYGGTFTADRDMRIATLGVGYADGFLRAFSKGGKVLINGTEAPIVGRICMDQCMVDIGENEVHPGDAAIIFDSEGKNINELAKAADTICYELVCLVGKRVRRIAAEE